ncbi:acyltransferase [Asaia bogorensis]|uniref:acyltransferase family protein n=1 Tax=Asaia bogorensis TaxID=91915 RepID=UPI000EFCE952|nr:acyltransferase [Asaia bogorensis]
MRKSDFLQAVRGFAASIVLVMHIFIFQSGFFSSGSMFYLTRVFSTFGGDGVDIFFVLSGFLMYGIAQKDAPGSRAKKSLKFATDRVFRIYPIFLVSVLFSYCVFLSCSGIQDANERFNLKGILLLSRQNGLNPVSWTLVYEVYFYFVVSVLVLIPARFPIVFWTWASLQCAYIYYAQYINQSSQFYIAWTPIITEFILGAFLRVIIDCRKVVLPRLSMIAGCSSLVITSIVTWFYQGPSGTETLSEWSHVAFVALPAALVMYGGLSLEQSGVLRSPKIMSWLGDISYSLYLFHVPVNSLFLFLMVNHGMYDKVPRPFYVILSIPICIAVSAFVATYVEMPLMKHSRWKGKRISGVNGVLAAGNH